ncbi:MAG: ABC-2 family transporter protein [Clostridiales bacterium]|nr:ABC-2 family transporter protein [Clostridiales bacterium]
MKAYLSVFRMRFRMETHYRGAVLGGIGCQIFFGLILVALYRALYAGKPQSMPLSHVTTYVWLQQAFFRMLLSSDADLSDRIRSGGIAYDLCRPLHLYGFYYARIMAQKLMGSLLRAGPMLAFAILLPDGWGISAPASPPALLLSVAALALGLCCMCAMENLTMAFTMRTMDPRGFQAMLNLLMMILTGNVLPLTLYPDSWQQVITRLPYAQMLDAPIRLYTGEYVPAQAPEILLLQAGWSLALILAGILFWQRNQRRLVLQGG